MLYLSVVSNCMHACPLEDNWMIVEPLTMPYTGLRIICTSKPVYTPWPASGIGSGISIPRWNFNFQVEFQFQFSVTSGNAISTLVAWGNYVITMDWSICMYVTSRIAGYITSELLYLKSIYTCMMNNMLRQM